MGVVKWHERAEKYTLDMMRTGILDISKVSSKFGISNRLVVKYAPKIAKLHGMVIIGITTTLTPQVMTLEEYGESKRTSKKRTIHKLGETISSSPKVRVDGEHKFMCEVEFIDSKGFLVVMAKNKSEAHIKIKKTYTPVQLVTNVWTIEEFRKNRRGIVTSVSARGSGTVKAGFKFGK